MNHPAKRHSRTLLREIVNRALLVILGFLFAFTLIEVGLHLVIPAPETVHMVDPWIGKRFIPNKESISQGADKFKVAWKAHIKANSLGWNSIEFTSKKPEGITRITHIGDSITEGIHVDTDKNFSSLLNNLLPNIESINLGIAGNGTYPELLTYRHYGREYDPDIVILWFSDNDFRDNLLVKQVIGTDQNAVIQNNDLGWLKKILLDNLRSPRLLYSIFFKNHLVVSALIKTGLLSMEPQEYNAAIPLLYRTTVLDTPERRDSTAITTKLLETLANDVQGDGKTLIIGYVPSYFETSENSEKELRELFPAIGDQMIEKKYPQKTTEAIAKKMNVPYFDLTDTFIKNMNAGGVPQIPGDGHLSVQGHDLVAKSLALWLREKNLCCKQ